MLTGSLSLQRHIIKIFLQSQNLFIFTDNLLLKRLNAIFQLLNFIVQWILFKLAKVTLTKLTDIDIGRQLLLELLYLLLQLINSGFLRLNFTLFDF